MGRLADKLSRANDAIANVELAVDRDIEVLIERTKTVHARREEVFLQKHMGLDQHMTDLAEFSKDLEDFGKNDHSSDGDNSGSAYVGAHPKP